jgi:hypothetical protein
MWLLFRSFMGFRFTFKAFGVILWYFKVDQVNQGGNFPKYLFLRGSIFSRPPHVCGLPALFPDYLSVGLSMYQYNCLQPGQYENLLEKTNVRSHGDFIH